MRRRIHTGKRGRGGARGREKRKGKKARNELLYYVLVEKIYQSSSLFDLSSPMLNVVQFLSRKN